MSAEHHQLFQLGLDWGRRFFDPVLDLVLFEYPPSSHSESSPGHITRESALYAFGLLVSGEITAAEKILERVLEKQNRDEKSPGFGVFTVLYEQDWATWKKPDPNWAQFIGTILGYVIAYDRDTPVLSASLRENVEGAFMRCVKATLQRDVTASYTNIALLSAALAAQAERLLGLPGAGEFSTRKAAAVLAALRQAGSHDEYLSPTYYGTSLDGIYGVRQFSKGERAAIADELIELTWRDIEEAYHPKTFQLGGPHSRAYGDCMLDYAAGLKHYLFLALDGEYPLARQEVNHSHDNAFAIIRSRFDVRPRAGLTAKKPVFREVHVPDQRDPKKTLTLRQYSQPEFHLGSVSEQDEWIQRRNLLAYWTKPPGCGIGFMKGYFRRGREEDRATRFFSVQRGPHVLVVVRANTIPTEAQTSRSEPSYRLVFNERAQWTGAWLHPGTGPLVFSAFSVHAQSVMLPPEFGSPAWARPMGEYSTEVTTDLVWTWPDAAKAGRALFAGFVLSFVPVGERATMIEDFKAVANSDRLTFSARVNGEVLSLSAPLA